MRYVSRRQNEVITDTHMPIENVTAKKTDFMQAYITVDSNATTGAAEVISKMVTSLSKVLNTVQHSLTLYFVAVLEILVYLKTIQKKKKKFYM